MSALRHLCVLRPFLKMTSAHCEHMPSWPLNLANKTNNLALMREINGFNGFSGFQTSPPCGVLSACPPFVIPVIQGLF
jgi:hypothetical protein